MGKNLGTVREGEDQAGQHVAVHTAGGHLIRKARCRVPQLRQAAPACSASPVSLPAGDQQLFQDLAWT